MIQNMKFSGYFLVVWDFIRYAKDMGIPVGRDMDGFARADLFRRSYTAERPVAYVATHER